MRILTMIDDKVQVSIVFTPTLKDTIEPSCGVFTFDVQDLIAVREQFFTYRTSRKQKRGQTFLKQQTNKAAFDWNAWVDIREDKTLASLIEMGLGKVFCQHCASEYPTQAIIVYEWTWQNWGGLQFACPQEHTLFTHTNRHGEFIWPDDRHFAKVRREK